MDVDDAEEYTQALGQVVAGGWRQIALGERLGVPEALGMTTREWVDQRLGGYVRLSIPERREAAAELVSEGMTQRQTADVLGVSPSTVNDDVRNRTEDASDAAPKDDDQVGHVRNRTSLKQRIARLDEDLAERVRSGLSIDEAELIQAQNEHQVDKWATRIRAGLEVLGRMAGYPIPRGISSRLTGPESEQLIAVLHALEPFKEGVAA